MLPFKKLIKARTTQAFRNSLRSVLQEAKISRLHNTGRRLAQKVPLPCKLHFGCGPNIKPGWVNIDLKDTADIQLDIREPMPFPDESATIIYSEHFFEHLDFLEGQRFLKEGLRVLRPGGLMSIGVPDAGLTLSLFVNGSLQQWDEYQNRFWIPFWCDTRMHSVNYTFRQEGEHRYAYDYETLAGSLRTVGFVNIRRRDWTADLDSVDRRGGTLYVDAEKPGGNTSGAAAGSSRASG